MVVQAPLDTMDRATFFLRAPTGAERAQAATATRHWIFLRQLSMAKVGVLSASSMIMLKERVGGIAAQSMSCRSLMSVRIYGAGR